MEICLDTTPPTPLPIRVVDYFQNLSIIVYFSPLMSLNHQQSKRAFFLTCSNFAQHSSNYSRHAVMSCLIPYAE